MTIYFFLRYILLTVLLIGWVFYQFVVKKKKLAELQADILFIACFACVWLAMSYIMLGD